MTISQVVEKLFPEESARQYLIFLAVLFVAAFLGGALVRDPAVMELVKKLVEQIKAPVAEMAGGVFFLNLLATNIIVTLTIMFLGVIGGVIPVFLVIMNGLVSGMICRYVLESEGARQVAIDMFSQVLFGIPAFLVVAAYGFWLGVGAIRRLRGTEEQTIGELSRIALRRYFTLVFPLLIASAAVETSMVLVGG